MLDLFSLAAVAADEVMVMRMAEGLDTGPVYGTLTEPAGPRDTAGQLLSRLAAHGADPLVATLDGPGDGRVSPPPPRDAGPRPAPRATPPRHRVACPRPAAPGLREQRQPAPALRVDAVDPRAWAGRDVLLR